MALSEKGRFKWRIALVALMLCMTCSAGFWSWCKTEERRLGQALFRGQEAIPATLAGQSMPLPSFATRCVNCHETRQPTAVISPGSAASVSQTYASSLSASGLKEPRLRHGGPESTYDARSLCQLLRTGIDPAMVMVDTVMPRYQASDAQCEALWAYLVSK